MGALSDVEADVDAPAPDLRGLGLGPDSSVGDGAELAALDSSVDAVELGVLPSQPTAVEHRAQEVATGMGGGRQSGPSSAPGRSSELSGLVLALSSRRGTMMCEQPSATLQLALVPATASLCSASITGTHLDDDGSDEDGPRSSTPKCLLDEDHRRRLLRAQPLLYLHALDRAAELDSERANGWW